MTKAIIDRIRKLLKLSKSSNPHEAALALENAQKLLIKHQLDLSMIPTDEPAEPIVKETIATDKKKRRITNWRGYIINGVTKVTTTRAIFNPGEGWNLIGKPTNIAIASDMISWICDQIEMFTRQAVHLSGKDEFDSFKKGAAITVYNRLITSTKQATVETPKYGELMVIENQLVDNAVKKFYPRIGKAPKSRPTSNSAYNQGKAVGQRVNIGRGQKLTHNPGRLLN